MQKQHDNLGEFEHIVLLTLLRLGDNAYGMLVQSTLKELIDRDISIGALYSTLERLEKKKLIHSKMGEATAQRGGKAKKYFIVSSLGKKALDKTRSNLETMWRDLTW